jgi:hypothetical protein
MPDLHRRVARLEDAVDSEDDITLETYVLFSYGDPAAVAKMNRPGRKISELEKLVNAAPRHRAKETQA